VSIVVFIIGFTCIEDHYNFNFTFDVHYSSSFVNNDYKYTTKLLM